MLGDKERHRRRTRYVVGGLILVLLIIGVVGAYAANRAAKISDATAAHTSDAIAAPKTTALTTPLAHPLPATAAVNTAPPAAPVKLVFVHHSTGEIWLADDYGGLGRRLRDNAYFVSDVNIDWDPIGDAIGSRTDLGHWWSWFRGPSSAAYLAALYDENGHNDWMPYSRLAGDPGGPNEIVMFKSCYPNSQLSGPDAPVPAIEGNPMKGAYAGDPSYTVANAKGIYRDLLAYFGAHPEKLFVAVVAPPLASPDTPGGRALANWLVDHWLQDSGYSAGNVLAFDLYDVLTSKTGGGASDVGLASGNHHRVWNGAVQHKTDDGADRLAYPTGDDHPSPAGLQKATAEFVPLLNAAYNAWRGNDNSNPSPSSTPSTSPAATPSPTPTATDPILRSLSPLAARRGATVKLAGRFFGTERGRSYVKFGATRAGRYISWTSTLIKCRVPAKARLGRVRVTVATGGGLSDARVFTVRR